MTLFLFDPKDAAISGRLYTDTNADNTEFAADGGFEPGLAGQSVQLLDHGGHVIRTTQTDGAGFYSFTGLSSGSYFVQFPTNVDGERPIQKDVGSFNTDSDANVDSGRTDRIHLDKGERVSEVDAGYTSRPLTDGVVDGAQIGEAMPVGYVDPQGDAITDGNDAIFGNDGNDQIDAGGGDDFVSAGNGDDFVEGGAGNDNLNGDAGDDDLRGNGGDDQLFGGSGDDELRGGDGADLLAGGLDNDLLLGGAGNDDLRGEDGDDFLSGGDGNDFVEGGNGNDSVNGDDGDDDLRGEAGNDELFGGNGDDELRGGEGNDLLAGASGSDFLDGETGLDTLIGGAGADDLRGGDDNDVLYGDGGGSVQGGGSLNLLVNGSFEDTTGLATDPFGFVGIGEIPGWTTADPNDRIEVFNVNPELDPAASDGLNALDLEGSPGNIRIGQNVQNLVDGEAYRLSFDVTDSQNLTATDGPDENVVDVFFGGVLIDTVDPSNIGESEFQTISLDVVAGSGNGNDRLEFQGRGVEDSIGVGLDNVSLVPITPAGIPEGLDFGAGEDFIDGGAGDDQIFGGDGNDDLRGGTGEDFLVGGVGNDQLIGGADDDALRGGSGDDRMFGEDGDDDMLGGTGSDSMDGGTGDDFMGGQDGDDTLTGGDGADLMSGDTGNDVLDGGTGEDTMFGGNGADDLTGGDGVDLMSGGADNDTLDGGSGNDAIYGDSLPEFAGQNLIQNGSFEDVSGLAGADYGFVGTGSVPNWTTVDPTEEVDIHNDGRDGVIASDGDNWLDLDASPGNIRIGQDVQGVVAGEDYELRFDVSDSQFLPTDGPDENLVNVYWGGDLVSTIDPSNFGESDFETITLTVTGGTGDGSNRLEFEGTGAEDNVGASVDNVSLVPLDPGAADLANGGNDEIDGGTGDDLIFGNGGDDQISGSEGNDTIFGDNGGDTGSDPVLVDVTPVAGAANSFIVWELSDATIVNASGNDDPFGNNSVGEDDVNGSTFTLNPGSVPTTVGINDNENLFEDGDNSQELVQGVTLNGKNVAAGEELEIEYSYSVQDSSGNVINIFAVEEDSDDVVGFISDAPLTVGETYTFVERTSTDPEIPYNNIATAYLDPDAGPSTGDDDGNGGDDTITGGAGADMMMGEGGDDTFIVGSSADGAGDVIEGGNGPDQTADNDVLDLRGAGAVTITDSADATDDGATAGTVTFEDGSTLEFSQIETILTDPLTNGVVDGTDDGQEMDLDFLDAEGDQITTGDDSILGNDGDDTIDGDAGDDTIDGGADNDEITGGDGNDSVDGGDDADTLAGGEGTDTLNGDAGDDEIAVGGDDSATGGTGDDVFTLDATDTAPDVDTTIDGGSDGTDGNPDGPENGDEGDTLDLSDQADALIVDLGVGDGESGTVDGLDTIVGDDDVTFDEIENILTGAGDDDIDGSDTTTDLDIDAGAGDDTVDGGSGNDSILGGDGEDQLFGNDGDDTLDGGADDDLLVGGDGDDSLDGGDGADILLGGEGTDTLNGGAGDDDIGVGGDDSATGGTGDDVFTIDTIDPTVDINATIDGGSDGTDGNPEGPENGDEGDILDLSDRPEDLTVVLDDTDPESGTADGLDADDTPDVSFDEIEKIVTGSGDDTVDADNADGPIDVETGAGNDSVEGGDGDDVISTGPGDDTVNSGDGADTVDAGEGNNLVDTSSDAAVPLPDDGFPGYGPVLAIPSDPDEDDDRDLVTTGSGDDTITTGDDNDTITAAGGDNLIDAGIDDDDITTGDGSDTIVGGEGNDTVSSGGGDDLIYGGLDPAVVPIDGTDIPDAPDGGSFGPDPDEDNGRDVIDAGAGNDTVFGGDDDDTIIGGAGNDELDGGVDDDLISGGDGDDTITGGQGADTLSGGDGSDTFIIENREDAFGDVLNAGTEDGDGDPATDNENDQLDLTGLGRFEIVQNDGTTPLDLSAPNDPDGNSFSGLVNFLDASDNVEGTLTFTEIEDVIPCFTPGTVIATPKGERLVEELAVGDRIITRDNGLQEIRWLGRRDLNGQELMSAPHLKPILIRAGSLGHGLPERDMMVSPQHRVLINNERSALYFEDREVLAAAKHLTGIEGVDPVDTQGVSYIHFMFDQHEVVLSNGAWTESFQPGEQVLDGMGTAQKREIFDLFPELQETDGLKAYQAARRSLKQHEAGLLVK